MSLVTLDARVEQHRVWLCRMLGARVLESMWISRAEWGAFVAEVRAGREPVPAHPVTPGQCGGVMPRRRFRKAPAHRGPVRPYVRICPVGHWRAALACDGCHGPYGAALCLDCPGSSPALLIPADVFRAFPFYAANAALSAVTRDRPPDLPARPPLSAG